MYICKEQCSSFELCSCSQFTAGSWQRRGRKLVLASALLTGSLGLLSAGQAGAAPGGSTSGSTSHTGNDTDNAAERSSSTEKSGGDERAEEAARQLAAAAALERQTVTESTPKPSTPEPVFDMFGNNHDTPDKAQAADVVYAAQASIANLEITGAEF